MSRIIIPRRIFFAFLLFLLFHSATTARAQTGVVVAEVSNDGPGTWECAEPPQITLESGDACQGSCTREGEALGVLSLGEGESARIRCAGTCLPVYADGAVKIFFDMCGVTAEQFYYGVSCDATGKSWFDGASTHRAAVNGGEGLDEYCKNCRTKDQGCSRLSIKSSGEGVSIPQRHPTIASYAVRTVATNPFSTDDIFYLFGNLNMVVSGEDNMYYKIKCPGQNCEAYLVMEVDPAAGGGITEKAADSQFMSTFGESAEYSREKLCADGRKEIQYSVYAKWVIDGRPYVVDKKTGSITCNPPVSAMSPSAVVLGPPTSVSGMPAEWKGCGVEEDSGSGVFRLWADLVPGTSGEFVTEARTFIIFELNGQRTEKEAPGRCSDAPWLVGVFSGRMIEVLEGKFEGTCRIDDSVQENGLAVYRGYKAYNYRDYCNGEKELDYKIYAYWHVDTFLDNYYLLGSCSGKVKCPGKM